MPVVIVEEDELFEKLGRKYSEEELDSICFDFGIELDEVERKEGKCRYKFDLPSNRPDIISPEGLCFSLQIFLGVREPPVFRLEPPTPNTKLKIYVHPQVSSVRPYILSAILRDVSFTETSYKNFIDLQEKLHQTFCRRRTLVAIGTHDLDSLEGPFTYEALPPNQINFVALNQKDKHTAEQLMDIYETHPQLKQYLDIIRSSPVYPVIYDRNRVVLSLPPIINGEHSKISLNTKNVFIECTAVDLQKAEIVLKTLVHAFSQYSAQPHTVEPVMVEYDSSCALLAGQTLVYPDVQPTEMMTSVEYLCGRLGISVLEGGEVCSLLKKMGLIAHFSKQQNKHENLKISIPFYRSDIMHACDVSEDLAISYGYNRMPVGKSVVCVPAYRGMREEEDSTVLEEEKRSALEESIRDYICSFGYVDIYSWGLCSEEEANMFLKWTNVGEKEGKNNHVYTPNYDAQEYSICEYYGKGIKCAVRAKSPKTRELAALRPSHIPGLLKSLRNITNKHMPFKLFEVGDVHFMHSSGRPQLQMCLYVAAVFANGKDSGFEDLHSLLDRLMSHFMVSPDYDLPKKKNINTNKPSRYFTLRPTENPLFVPKRQAEIVVKEMNLTVGVLGVLSPHVLQHFKVDFPVSVFEVNVESWLKWLSLADILDS